MRRPWRPALVEAAGAIIAIACIALALHTLAAMLTDAHVGDQALRRTALFAHRQSPWQWELHDRNGLVAQRVFGPAILDTNSGRGLRMTARSRDAYEIGLPLPSPADLGRASVLSVRLHTPHPLAVSVVTRPRLDAPSCLAALPDPSHRRHWNLQSLAWHHSDGRACNAPTRAAMIRLRFRQPPGSTVLLSRVALRLALAARIPDPGTAVRMHGPASAVAAQLKQLLGSFPATMWPMVILPPTYSPQQLLHWRDLALQLAPAAIVLPHGWASGHHATPPQAWHEGQWLGLALYMLALIALLAWRPPGSSRLWLDLVAALAGPLWAIAGLHLGSPLDWRQASPLLAGLVYALVAALRTRVPGEWRWIGGWRDYPAPLALLAVAMLLLLAFGHAWSPPSVVRILVYLAWASLQQWLILVFVLRRLELVVPARCTAIIAVATLFALLHTPNARLMLLCFGAELYWAWCFTRRRTLLPIALAHATGALLVQAALTDGWLRSLGISARYFLPS